MDGGRGGGSGNVPGFAGSGAGLVGRDAELARLRGLIDPPPAMSRVLVLLGDAGMGKTMLLSAVASSAAESGMTVLLATGRESERDLAFAALHQLLRPVLGRVPDLPQRQARALLSAFALSDDLVPADPLLTGMAVLTLLGAVADRGPLLVVADDTQWLDDASLAALAFAARRLDAEPVTLLAAVRGSGPPGALDRGFAELMLPPLSDTDAGRLLEAQPHPPRGRARQQVLAEAAGNPMALVELSRVIAADPAAGRRWSAEPLRPPDRLAAIAAAQFGLLPAETRSALLLAAVADTTDLTSVGLPALSAAALAPAEAAGLIRVDTAGPQFPHPLVRSAVYHAVPFAERAAAHRRIAEAVRGQPDRYAWHLAAAALAPDEEVAALLEETAAQAQRRGGMMAAGRALERAAELSPDTGDQGRRLIAAMDLAQWADQSDWLLDLADRVLAVSADPVQRILARSFAGWALVWSSRHADALALLLSVAEEAPRAGLPAAAWRVVALAANVAYQTGLP
ncbi:MAG TPA: AAA family ATPase, partial [Trebonia sp.]